MRAASALRALVFFVVILLIMSAQAASATAPSDDFNRADGSLGAGWSAISDGALSISSQAVVGTSATAGGIRTAETYGSDQSSQIQLTSTQLSGGQWAGPSVRTQNGGQDTYLGIYFWNNGSPQLRLYKRSTGTWIQLGSSYNSGALAAGTTLQLSAAGSTISFLQDGVTRITATDTSISGGAPGIMTYGQATADNWTGGGASGSASTYTVGGTVTGLSGTLVLQDNGGDDLTLTANGAFTFATSLTNGDAYTVTVKTNPSGQTCTVANGTGTIAGTNIANVAVTCSTPLAPGGSDNFNRANGGLGAGWTAISDGALSISSQTVVGTNATAGDIRVAEAYGSDQSSQIQLTSTQLTGGQWIGPAVRMQSAGQNAYLGMYFWNNGTPQLRLYKRNAGSWTQLGSSYSSGRLGSGTTLQVLAVGTRISLLQNGVERVAATDASVTGGAPGIIAFGRAKADNWVGAGATDSSGSTYSVGGSVSGLSGTVVLRDNGGDDLTLTANGAFTFATSLTNGAAYNVTVRTNPSGQTCSVANGTGTIAAANVTNVAVTCASSPTYSVGGSVSGLSGTVVLQDNGGDDLTLTANGPFTFATELADGAAYNVTVKTNPSGQTCSVANGTGTIAAANVTNVALTCASSPTYSVGGSVSGLSGTVVLQDNGGDDLTLTTNGAFTFATELADGAAYNVTVKTNPSGQTCSVADGTGTIAAANVTNVALTCGGSLGSGGSDDFNRPDGSLGSNWVAMSDGALSIASQAVVGTSATAGDIRIAETYSSDQSSQIELTSTQLSGGQWVGPAVRAQNGGQDTYLGIYFWNNGSQQLRLYKRNAGTWTQLGSSYNSGPLPAGTKLQVSAVGSTISFLQDGVTRIAATDGSITGGAPGIMTYGQAKADNWTGGDATAGTGNSGFSVTYRSTDANGVDSYDVTSDDNGYGTQTLRVLAPTHPAAGVPHSFLYVLPVEAGLGTTYGDGIATLEALDAQNQYNLTIVEPSFAIEPWYADNPNDSNLRYETFMTNDLVPWVTQNLSTTGHEQNWLIGFSKSGIGGQDLILKHPDVFTLAASWDFPADMSSYGQFWGSANEYGTDANFQANYRLTPIFLEAHKLPFISNNRIWIGGYQAFQTDMSDYDALLNSEGIPHTTETPTLMPHRWDSGWVQIALAALSQDSQNLATSP